MGMFQAIFAWSQSLSIHTLLLSIIFCQTEAKKDIGKIFRGDIWVGSISAGMKRQHVNPRNQLWVPSEWWCNGYRLSSENCQHLAILQRKWNQNGECKRRASEPHRTFLPREGMESVQESNQLCWLPLKNKKWGQRNGSGDWKEKLEMSGQRTIQKFYSLM